ncbi:O-antigen ligase family protein [Lentzea aerocolonigenes]|uniref:O-antigen ligase family protein n=1 Tax=Lentzea aerocolonigenes TaxID=68170 RepID=UPI000AB3DC4C|nr:O-antigen ligase family protein [Lentzea aerocolonigenes]MCP2250978.1 O-antigen ligase like membrane protein [Lentzea aerocolonigenes]
MVAGDVVGARRESVTLPLPVLLVVAGFAAAVVAQGGYYLPGRVMSGLLVGVAVVLARPRPNLVAALGGAFALWAAARGLIEGDVLSALPAVAAAAVFVGAVLVAAQADQEQRELLATVVVGVGGLVAFTGWVAVVFRVPSWTTVAEGLLRAASTLTYPNAAAAVMAAAAVLSLVLRPTLPTMGLTYLLCTGIGATMSRAGVIALAAGLLVLCVCRGFKTTVIAAAPPLLGAAVAVAALLPTMRVADEPQVLVAVGGLVAGALVALGLRRLGRFVVPVAVLLAAGGAAAAAGFADRLSTRVSFSSPDRSQAAQAALELVAKSPVLGVGPGNGSFFFARGNEGTRVMRYVHNEYLQVLVELGAVGLLLALGVVAAVLIALWRGRGTPLWAGAVAAVVVVLVHSGFDFLWHLPVVLIVAGLCAGLGFPSTRDGEVEGTTA